MRSPWEWRPGSVRSCVGTPAPLWPPFLHSSSASPASAPASPQSSLTYSGNVLPMGLVRESSPWHAHSPRRMVCLGDTGPVSGCEPSNSPREASPCTLCRGAGRPGAFSSSVCPRAHRREVAAEMHISPLCLQQNLLEWCRTFFSMSSCLNVWQQLLIF